MSAEVTCRSVVLLRVGAMSKRLPYTWMREEVNRGTHAPKRGASRSSRARARVGLWLQIDGSPAGNHWSSAMGRRRKATKKIAKKSRNVVAVLFKCPFCNTEDSVEVMDALSLSARALAATS